MGWEPAQGYKEWAVTAVEKCFESLRRLTYWNLKKPEERCRKITIRASKSDFLSSNDHQNGVFRKQISLLWKEDISLAANEQNPIAVFGWFCVDRGCSQASDGSTNAIAAADPVMFPGSFFVPCRDMDTSNSTQGCPAPPTKLLQRSAYWNWLPPAPSHHWLRHLWETWCPSPSLPRGVMHPHNPFGCRQLLHSPATPGAAGAQQCTAAGTRQRGGRVPSSPASGPPTHQLPGTSPDSAWRQGRTHRPPARNGATLAPKCVLNSHRKQCRHRLWLYKTGTERNAC